LGESSPAARAGQGARRDRFAESGRWRSAGGRSARVFRQTRAWPALPFGGRSSPLYRMSSPIIARRMGPMERFMRIAHHAAVRPNPPAPGSLSITRCVLMVALTKPDRPSLTTSPGPPCRCRSSSMTRWAERSSISHRRHPMVEVKRHSLEPRGLHHRSHPVHPLSGSRRSASKTAKAPPWAFSDRRTCR
jgi:hypothetical protein